MSALDNDAGGSLELPKEGLIRATDSHDMAVRETDSGMPTLYGHFAVFNQPTEINSMHEGNFIERIAPGAFKKTFREAGGKIKILFQHGRDPQVGDKPLGVPTKLEEDEVGARYEVPLFDGLVKEHPLLVDGLRAGAYGASFKFEVLREDLKQNPDPSEENPKGLPERTIREARVFEAGPVTFPAYEGATAGVRTGVRSLQLEDLTPVVIAEVHEPTKTNLGDLADDVLDVVDEVRDEPITADEVSTLTDEIEVAPSHPQGIARRDTQPEGKAQTKETKMNEYRSVEEVDVRLSEIEAKQNEIYAEWGVRSFDAETQIIWDEMKDEKDALRADKESFLQRKLYIENQAKIHGATEGEQRGAGHPSVRAARDSAPENVFDMSEYHSRSSSQEHMGRLLTEGANRAVEGFDYPNPDVDPSQANKAIHEVLSKDKDDKEIAQRLLVHGSPTYRSAFWKTLAQQPLNADEQRKMSEGMRIEARALTAAGDGGITVPAQIDPTLLLTSSGALNPLRQIAKIVRTTSFQWQAVTTAGVSAVYRAEGAAMADGTPTLVAPTITPERMDVFVPYTWEAGQDWAGLEGEMGALFADAKDIVEATKFSVGAGHGSTEPQGVLVGAGTLVGGATITVGTADIYRLEGQLPVRFQPRASWLATPSLFSKIRQVAGGQTTGIWADSLQVGQPGQLLGYPAYKASNIGTAWADLGGGPKFAIIGDFNYFAIVDRIGFQVKPIPVLFNGNTAGGIAYPNGMSGLVGYCRNSSGVLASNAFRTGTVT